MFFRILMHCWPFHDRRHCIREADHVFTRNETQCDNEFAFNIFHIFEACTERRCVFQQKSCSVKNNLDVMVLHVISSFQKKPWSLFNLQSLCNNIILPERDWNDNSVPLQRGGKSFCVRHCVIPPIFFCFSLDCGNNKILISIS